MKIFKCYNSRITYQVNNKKIKRMYKEVIDYDIYQWLLSLNVLSSVTMVK